MSFLYILPYIFKVLYVLCFTRPRYQVSVYRTIGALVNLVTHLKETIKLQMNVFYIYSTGRPSYCSRRGNCYLDSAFA